MRTRAEGRSLPPMEPPRPVRAVGRFDTLGDLTAMDLTAIPLYDHHAHALFREPAGGKRPWNRTSARPATRNCWPASVATLSIPPQHPRSGRLLRLRPHGRRGAGGTPARGLPGPGGCSPRRTSPLAHRRRPLGRRAFGVRLRGPGSRGGGTAHRAPRSRAGGHGRGHDRASSLLAFAARLEPLAPQVAAFESIAYRTGLKWATRAGEVERSVLGGTSRDGAGPVPSPGREAAHRRDALGRPTCGPRPPAPRCSSTRDSAIPSSISGRPIPCTCARCSRPPRCGSCAWCACIATRTSAKPVTWPACTPAPTSTWGSPCPIRACTPCGAALHEALHLAPVTKVLLSTDAQRTPETFWLAAAGDAACSGGSSRPPTADGDLSTGEADWAGRRILFENAADLYGRRQQAGFLNPALTPLLDH